MKKFFVTGLVLSVLAGCSLNGQDTTGSNSKVIDVQATTDPAVNAALPTFSEQDLQILGFVSGDSLAADQTVYSYGQGPLYDNRAVRGKKYSFSVYVNPADSNQTFSVVYGFSADNLNQTVATTNVYSSYYATITIPANAPSRIFWKVVDGNGIEYKKNGQLWNAFIFDRIVSYSYQDSFYSGANDGVWINYCGPEMGAGMQLHYGWNNWSQVSNVSMRLETNSSYYYTADYATVQVELPEWANYLDFAINNNGSWDNNNGSDFHTSVKPLVTIQPNNTYVNYDGTVVKTVSINFANGNIGDEIWGHYGTDGWQNIGEAKLTTYHYNGYVSPVYSVSVTVTPSSSVLDVAFHNNDGQWDNNFGQDWHGDISWR